MITHIHPTDKEAARALIGRILRIACDTPESRPLNIALSGGTTPALMFRLWAGEYGTRTDWSRLRFFWVDERCVPPTDPESNYGMAREYLLDKVGTAAENVFRIKGENPPGEEAMRYGREVCRLVGVEDGVPAFDIVLLGAGDDGHTSSIFPGQEHLLTTHEPYAVGIHPVSGQRRVALTGQPIMHARHLIFLITGSGKARTLDDILARNDAGAAAYVARHALHTVEIFTDHAAAGRV